MKFLYFLNCGGQASRIKFFYRNTPSKIEYLTNALESSQYALLIHLDLSLRI